MRNPHQIVIAFLYVLVATNPVTAISLNGALMLDTLRAAHGPMEVAGTSEPPGPGCPSIPGGPGPLPDDDDDDEVALG
jgi:hypothetical protein